VTTSASYDFSVTRDDIIQDAYEELGVLEEGETPTADQVTSASRKLNMLVKTWGKRYSLHLLQDVVLFQVALAAVLPARQRSHRRELVLDRRLRADHAIG
jgi:anti-sigma-K factor RskA